MSVYVEGDKTILTENGKHLKELIATVHRPRCCVRREKRECNFIMISRRRDRKRIERASAPWNRWSERNSELNLTLNHAGLAKILRCGSRVLSTASWGSGCCGNLPADESGLLEACLLPARQHPLHPRQR